MAEIYIKYSSGGGFSRANDKGGLSGNVMSYADFKGVDPDTIKNGGEYGIILDSGDVKDFIANYEDESVFSDAEKA